MPDAKLDQQERANLVLTFGFANADTGWAFFGNQKDQSMSASVLERDITWEEATASLAKSMERFARHDVEGILARYADDVSIRFAELPEIRGKAAAKKFLRARFAIQLNYKVHKSLLLVSGQKYGNNFTASWTDGPTGKLYEARGVEILELKDGKVINWDCSYNLWEVGKANDQSYFGGAI